MSTPQDKHKSPGSKARGGHGDDLKEDSTLSCMEQAENNLMIEAIRQHAFMTAAATIYAGYLAKDRANRHSDDELLQFAIDDVITLRRGASRHD